MKRLISLLLAGLLMCSPCWATVDFNGDADSVARTDDSGVDTFPISMYYLVEAGGGDGWVGGFSVSTVEQLYIAVVLLTSSNLIRYYVRNNNSAGFDQNGFCVAQYSATINAGDLLSIITVSDDSTTHKLYVNGTLIDTDVHTCTVPASINRTSIGAILDNDPSYGNDIIHEFAAWNAYSLTLSDVDLLSNSNVRLANQISPGDLMVYWRLDDHPEGLATIDATTWKDYSPNGNDGTGSDADGDSNVLAETVLTYP